MPTYEYRCPNGHDTERFFRKISDSTAEIECPQCGATAERRLSGGAGLLFKGSGFYLTDYGRSGAKGKSDDGGGDSGKSSDAAKKTSSTPEAKTGSESSKPAKPADAPKKSE